MTGPVEFLEEALAEAQQAEDYLERARPGLGAAFTNALQEGIARIQHNPELGPSAEFGYATRRWKIARFPYSIIYVLSAGTVVVIAIAHERRRPGYWRGRADD